ncbi:glycosyltransferase family 4 protein [Rhodovulum sp. DZ06]|uniref:glycosyltransferase family 4 protein n=1 Tax=Rhodovulum sp. DZ06 TaxID=3425126 RepID=UPI003D3361BE
MTRAMEPPLRARAGDGRPAVAFHAPMKPPDHPTPSGDREIARLTMRALDMAGFAPFLATSLRTLDMEGDRLRQSALKAEADLEVERLVESFAAAPPALWFTYHNYWKAPDLVGPRVAEALGIPYVISEASHSAKRLAGPWSFFAEAARGALDAAARVYWTTGRDRPGLARAMGETARDRLAPLPPFIDIGPRPAMRDGREDADGPLRLLTVAMMRRGDKSASYARLADALALLDGTAWRLSVIGDGPERPVIQEMFDRFEGRVEFSGLVEDPALLREAYEASELLVWPGVGEGIGMVYLEAQAAALPCLAEDRPGPRDVVLAGGMLPAPGDAAGLAAAIRDAAADRGALAERGRAARLWMEQRHSLEAAASRLRADLGALIGASA